MSAWKEHLRRAVQLAGSQYRLARAMGCSQGKISWLLLTSDEIATEDAVAVHRATDGQVPAHLLRPDIFREGYEPPPIEERASA